MNSHCMYRIEMAKSLINGKIDLYKDEVLAIYISSSVGRGDSDENSDIDLHLVYKEYGRKFNMYATLENDIVVDWAWEPFERYSDIEEVKSHFAKPHNINNSICIYDPQGWFQNLKDNISPCINSREYAAKRAKLLWDDKSKFYYAAINTCDYKEFEKNYKGFLSAVLIPLAACSVDPSARKLLLQAKNSLVKLGAGKDSDIFEHLFGCYNIDKAEALYYLNKMIETFDYCLEVQSADYHGINQPKRNYHYYGIKKFIDDGYHKEAIYPIRDWITVADYRITKDTGTTGWWTQNKNELYKRLGVCQEYMSEKKEIMNKTVDIIKKYCLIQ